MSFEVIEEHANPLLGRREAKLVVHHEGHGTPDRITIRKMASEHFKAGIEQVFVRSIATRTGGSSALCVVEVYENPKAAEIVPAYVRNRNLPKDQRVSKQKKEAEPKPAAPAPKPPPEKKTEKPEAAKAEKREDAKPAAPKEEKGSKEAKPPKAEAKPKA